MYTGTRGQRIERGGKKIIGSMFAKLIVRPVAEKAFQGIMRSRCT